MFLADFLPERDICIVFLVVVFTGVRLEGRFRSFLFCVEGFCLWLSERVTGGFLWCVSVCVSRVESVFGFLSLVSGLLMSRL